MTCTNCKKLVRENNKLREKVEIMERDIHIAQIEENSDRYEAILDQAKEHIKNCLAGRRSSIPTLWSRSRGLRGFLKPDRRRRDA
jgi:hypothetical protein